MGPHLCHHISTGWLERPGLDGLPDRAKYAEGISARFLAEDFELLEQLAKELRSSKARFLDGIWELSLLYSGLDPQFHAKRPEAWTEWFQKLDRWKAAHPDSITEQIARAEALTSYAWKARGSGWASTVKPEGGRLFEQRLAQAHAVLDAAKKLPDKCPHWYVAMQRVALGEGWDRKDYERLFLEAVKLEPQYYQYYLNKAHWLLPRWYGKAGEWERFADQAAREHDPEEGMSVYARTAWANSETYSNLFEETAIEWPKMKQGFLDIEKRYPDSRWNLNAFCKFAAMAGDRETTRALLERIGGKPYVAAWGNIGAFERAKLFVAGDQGQVKPLATLRLSRPLGVVRAVSFSPDGATLAAGYESGLAVVWNVSQGKEERRFEVGNGEVASTAYSPDGTLLAASSGYSYDSPPGVVKVWELSSGKLRATIDGWNGQVSTVRFTPDGSALLMAGGPFNKKSEAWRWDVKSGKAEPLKWVQEHTPWLNALSISPDSQLMAADCNKGINVWSLADEKLAFDLSPKLKLWFYSLAFSPDGKILAGGLANRPEGGIAIVDVAGWQVRKPGIATATGPIWTVAVTPDSRLLVGGGDDQCVRIWQLATGEEIATYYGHEGMVLSVAVSPDGKTIASASQDGTVKLWPTPAGK